MTDTRSLSDVHDELVSTGVFPRRLPFSSLSFQQYATSCPANLGAHFGRPPGSKLSSMSVLEEGAFDEEGGEGDSPEPKSKTALSILESLASAARTASAAPADDSGVDAESESVESADSVEGAPVEDVFELEGLDGVSN